MNQNTERRVPIVTAIFACLVFAVLIFGIVAFVITHVMATNSDEALHLDGTWETVYPTHNDAIVTFTFNDESFSSVTEMMIVDADLDIIEGIRDFYHEHYGAVVYDDNIGDGSFALRVVMDGTFGLYEEHILLISGEAHFIEFTFHWDGEMINIDGDLFVRQ